MTGEAFRASSFTRRSKFKDGRHTMGSENKNSSHEDALATVLGNSVAYVANEVLVLAQYEVYQEDSFARLWPPDDQGTFDKRMNAVVEHLGGPPECYIVREGNAPPPADNYPGAALREVFDVFYRSRKSVLRAHLFMTGSTLLAEQPDIMNLPDTADGTALFIKHSQLAFWEHAEAAYIRLYSFWDRVGQVLDFAFFNIRKFDQNGFHAVMNRIHANIVPMRTKLGANSSWKRLRAFQSSEKEDGLKWLLSRRNMVVHSLHLHPVRDDEEDVFKSQFNHLASAHREKLRPRDPPGEAALLLKHLDRAASLFSDLLVVIEASPSRKVDKWQ
jgi:hypothetical protein